MSSNRDPPIPLPPPTASAETVRTYIFNVLTSSHGCSQESSQHSAAEWKTGNGSSLKEMKISQMRTTFGNRTALILYKEVRTQVIEEKYAASPMPTREFRVIAATVAIEMTVTLIYIFLLRLPTSFAILIFWALGLCMVIQMARDAVFARPTPGEVVEGELRAEFCGEYP
ncbi:hypothetical protein Q7P37_010353 [Cladosporium fusiforme]